MRTAGQEVAGRGAKVTWARGIPRARC
jgi:hypothetical protein